MKNLSKCWRQACNRIILIIHSAVREAPSQIWRFKEDFLEGMIP